MCPMIRTLLRQVKDDSLDAFRLRSMLNPVQYFSAKVFLSSMQKKEGSGVMSFSLVAAESALWRDILNTQ